MGEPLPAFTYSSDLEEYAVNAAEFLRKHQEYDILCTGVAVFNKDGKLLLVQRAADEKAFPNAWEVPGGKVDDEDETLLHAAARELKEETGLTATRAVRKVHQFTFLDGRPGRAEKTWLKLVFEMEVQDTNVTLDPVEHQKYVFASEDEVMKDVVGDVQLVYVSPPNKTVKLEAFRLQKEAVPS